jgi:Leucine-rich repeat (LRR) protein
MEHYKTFVLITLLTVFVVTTQQAKQSSCTVTSSHGSSLLIGGNSNFIQDSNDDFLRKLIIKFNSRINEHNKNTILKCYNVTLTTVNAHYFPTSLASSSAVVTPGEIILDHLINNGRGLDIKGDNQIELLKWVNSSVTNQQVEHLLLRGDPNKFDHLKLLDLSANQITRIETTYFSNLNKLKVLILSNNSLNTLLPDVFSASTELIDLNLSHNSFEALSKNTFVHLINLLRLDLSNNTINDLPHNTFKGLDNLEILDLANNKLHVIPFQLFKDLQSMETLILSNNMLVSFLDNFFLLNKPLRILKIDNNLLEKISKNSLHGLSNLHELDASSNKLIFIDRDAFDSLENLRYLNLRNNQIYTFSQSVWSGLKNLQILDLSRNLMRTMPNGLFANQHQLSELLLDGTHLEVLSNWVSRNNKTINKEILQNLKFLSIRNNSRLEEIEDCFFSNLPGLESLYLSDNRLMKLPKEIGEANQLKTLDISNNKLAYIPEQMKNLNQLGYVNLLNNDFSCDCHMYWLVEWIDTLQQQNQSNRVEILKLSELKCRNGYPGDILRVLQHLNCYKPVFVEASKSKMHLLKSEATLECVFNGNPQPDIIWITPWNELLRHRADPDQKPVLLDTESDSTLQHVIQSQKLTSEKKMKKTTMKRVSLLENGTLKVHNISRTDSGLYTCYAFSIMGNATSDIR